MIIRAANKNDIKAIAKINIDVWKTTYSGIVPSDF
jgi:hypothetical protein